MHLTPGEREYRDRSVVTHLLLCTTWAARVPGQLAFIEPSPMSLDVCRDDRHGRARPCPVQARLKVPDRAEPPTATITVERTGT